MKTMGRKDIEWIVGKVKKMDIEELTKERSRQVKRENEIQRRQ